MSYPRLGKFCGNDKPKYYATGSYTLIQFTTDSRTNDEGFVIKYYLENEGNKLQILFFIVYSMVTISS